MEHVFAYEPMPLAEAAGLYAMLVAASLAAGWVFFYKLGQVLLALLREQSQGLQFFCPCGDCFDLTCVPL